MLQNKIKDYIQKHFPEMYASRLLLAVSGGVDSMVMLHVLKNIGLNIMVAHCNFKLRGHESESETQFLEKHLQKNEISYRTIYFDTEDYAAKNKLSIQLAARKLRYDWFYDLLNKYHLDFIVTAHHLDDQVETFLINVTRGTGIDGMFGIPNRNDKILRPFLNVSRNEILEYAELNGIEWREDSSNASTKYFRNKIRHKVVPVLKELNTDFLETFSDTLYHLNQFNDGFYDGFNSLKKQIVTQVNNIYTIDLLKLRELKAPQSFLYHFLKPFGFTAWADIYDLIDAQSGKMIFSDIYVLLKDRDCFYLKKNEENETEKYVINQISDFNNLPFKITAATHLLNDTISQSQVILDLETLKFPLVVRHYQKGDYFYPFGMQGKKKVSKYFKDEKFSQFQKNQTWLLVQNNNIDIIWIIGHRADKRFVNKLNPNTKLFLQI